MRKRLCAVLFILLFSHAGGALVQAQSRIIGGSDAPPGAYPWMAALVEKNRSIFQGQFCGGMLVAPQWVLTAAHCVQGENRKTFDVWVGLHDLDNPAGAQKRKVAAIIRHPNFRTDRYDNVFYDAALILLDTPVTGITPVGLASLQSHNDVGSMVRALGWGTTHPVFDVFPSKLKEVDLQIADLADAQADYQNILGPSHLAAAVPSFSKDTCAGDSGGPLFRIIGGNHILVGVVSFGDGCAEPDFEGIYTNVLHIRAWIDGLLQLTAQPPDSSVQYRSREISHADRSPSGRDGTYFGNVRAAGRGKTRTYRIRNDGAGLLIVRALRSGNRTFDFPGRLPTLVSPGGNPGVRLKFQPRRRGNFSTLIRLITNDPTNPFFWFRVRGRGR